MADRAVLQIVKDLQRRFGDKGEVSVLGDGLFAAEPREWISTGITLLDRAIKGGIPVGRLTEIFGGEVTGKTLLAMAILGEAQKAGAWSLYIDTEYATSRDFAKKLGHIDPPGCPYPLLHAHVGNLEDLFDCIEGSIDEIRDGYADPLICIVADSLAALPTRAEQAAAFDEQTRMALAASIIRRAMRKLSEKICKQRVAVIFTNHQIANIGAKPWEEKFVTWGGSGPKYHCSVRLRLQQAGTLRSEGDPIGAKIRATVIKNRHDPWGRKVEYQINYRGPYAGLDDVESIFTYLKEKGVFGIKVGWFEYGDKKYRKEELLDKMRSEPDFMQVMRDKAIELLDQIGGVTEESPEVMEAE